MNLKVSNHPRVERGQALAEYVVLFPIAIAIIMVAGILTDMIIDSFSHTTQALELRQVRTCEQDEPAEEEGTTHADLDCHTIDLVSDLTSDGKTIITYQVSSNCDPSISHWTLAMSPEVFALVEGASEQYEFGTDPTTGVTGIKFDTGYEGGSSESDDSDSDGEDGKGKPPKKTRQTWPNTTNLSPSASETRTVMITLGGHVDWADQVVVVKAGTHTHYSTISAPVMIVEEDPSCLQ
jgi:hypothetical protein